MNKFTKEANYNFWQKEAKKYGLSSHGAHSDKQIVELENEFIIKKLIQIKPDSLLDIGCGNGIRTILFSKFVKKNILGIDYSEEMIKNAIILLKKQNKSIQKKIEFKTVDVISFQNNETYDAIISCRCLINQNTTTNQIKLLKNIHKMLKPNGSLIIAEGSHEGYELLNDLRKKFKLKPIKISNFNLPLKEKIILKNIKHLFKIIDVEKLGTYYFLTRIIFPSHIYPKEPKPNSKFNKLAMLAEKRMLKTNDNKYEQFGAHILGHFIKK